MDSPLDGGASFDPALAPAATVWYPRPSVNGVSEFPDGIVRSTKAAGGLHGLAGVCTHFRFHFGSCAHQPSGAKIQKQRQATATASAKTCHRSPRRNPVINPTTAPAAKAGRSRALPLAKKSPGVQKPQATHTTVNSANAQRRDPVLRTATSRVLISSNIAGQLQPPKTQVDSLRQAGYPRSGLRI
jgi:hypothetical protein